MKYLILGGLLLLLCSPPGLAQVPPPVANLAVSHVNGHLSIKFTAPTALVAKFAIKFAETSSALEGANFSNEAFNEELDENDLLPGSTLSPPAPESNVTLRVDPFNVFEGQTEYFFAMKSVDASGLQWSDISNIVSVTPDHAGDVIAPTAIQDLNVTYANGELTVMFTCPSDDPLGTDPVAKISIRYATVGSNLNASNFHNDMMNDEVETEDLMTGSTLTPPPTGNTTVSISLNPLLIFESAAEYFFAIKTADDSLNWSGVSNIVSIQGNTTPNPGKPAAVTNLEVTHTNGRLAVKFTSPITAVSKFVIKFAETSLAIEGVNFSNDSLNEELDQSDLLPGSVLSPPSPGTNVTLQVDPFNVFEGQLEYFFAMKSVDATGLQWSDTSNIVSVTPDHAGDVIAPAAIQDLNVTYAKGEMTVTFTCPGDDGIGTDPVAKISIRFATASMNINEVNFHNDNLNDEVDIDDLMTGSTLDPPAAGNTLVTIKLNPIEIFESAPEYFFAIKTADDSLNWSELSNIVSVLEDATPNPNGPTTVTDLAVAYQNGQLSLTFTAPGASPGSQLAVSRFLIKYSYQAGYVGEIFFENDAYNDEIEVDDLLSGSLVPPTANSVVTLQLAPYEIFDEGYSEYFFSMKSVDGLDNWSSLSNVASVLATTAPNPTGSTPVNDLQASYQNGQLSLTFTAPAASPNSQDAVNRFVIKYSFEAGYVNENFFANDGYNDEIEVDDLLPGSGSSLVPPAPNSVVTLQLAPYEIFDDGHQEYFFSMKSVNSLNKWSVLSNIVSVVATTGPNPNGPTAVTDLKANYENGELSLTFMAPAASPDSQLAVSRFIIKYARSSGYVDDTYFNNDDYNDEIEVDDLMPGSNLIPPAPNTQVSLKLRANEILEDGIGEYYFSMKSVDSVNSFSGISNIASVSYNSSSNIKVNTFTLMLLALAYCLVWTQN